MPIKDHTSIDERPPEADGTRCGDREMDLIVGADNRMAMVTLVERSTGFTMDKETQERERCQRCISNRTPHAAASQA